MLTSLTGNTVNINVEQHTELTGATIAAIDEDGNDNGQLTLNTNTLSASSLNNITQEDSLSQSISAGSTTTLDYQNDQVNKKTKVLATLGSGTINIDDVDNSDIKMLNSDVENNEVDIYDIESHQGLSATVDTRLFSESGRDQIAEDMLKTAMIGNTISLIVNSKKVSLKDFFSETDKKNISYEAVKKEVANNPDLAAALQNPDLTPEQKEVMLDTVVSAALVALGYEPVDNKIIATTDTTPEGEQFAGFYSEETGDAYINDTNNDNTQDLIITAGHEASHGMDDQDGVASDDDDYYAENFGENLASYTDFALDISNQGDGLATTNSHTGNSNSQTLQANNATYAETDKALGDYRLTKNQEAAKANELSECKNAFCRSATETKYNVISGAQGAAEAAGAVTGAVGQTADDITTLIGTVMLMVDYPEGAEQEIEALNQALDRIDEISKGSPTTQAEVDKYVGILESAAAEAQAIVEDASQLDGEGLGASFDEGQKYGVYLAGMAGVGKINKYLKSLGKVDGNDVPDGGLAGHTQAEGPFSIQGDPPNTYRHPDNPDILRASTDHPQQTGSFVSSEFPNTSKLPEGVLFEGNVSRYEYPNRLDSTWDAHQGNVASDHRYSGPGEGAVYGGTNPTTALDEVRHYGAEDGRVLTQKDASLNNVLDLTDSNTRNQIGVTADDITGNTYTITHSIGSTKVPRVRSFHIVSILLREKRFAS